MSFFDDEFLLTSFSNFLGISQIGSGKTLAFVLPSFVKLLNRPPPTRSGPCRPSMLILSPIRESALQTKDVISSFDLFKATYLPCRFIEAPNLFSERGKMKWFI